VSIPIRFCAPVLSAVSALQIVRSGITLSLLPYDAWVMTTHHTNVYFHRSMQSLILDYLCIPPAKNVLKDDLTIGGLIQGLSIAPFVRGIVSYLVNYIRLSGDER